jgi:hypothetical protein
MNKAFQLVIMLFLLTAIPSFAATVPESEKPQTNIVQKLNVRYQKGRSREQLSAYMGAAAAYKDILKQSLLIINNGQKSSEDILSVMPFAISSGYRLGLITQWINAENAEKLYEQLQSYKDAQDDIEKILTSIANLEIDRGINIPNRQYNHLYYARAYIRLSWASALINGNAWKRYFIYMPADAVLMINASMQDLKKMFANYSVTDPIKDNDADRKVEQFSAWLRTAPREEQLTLKLSFFNPQLETMGESIRKNVTSKAREVLVLYSSPQLQNSLATAKDFRSIDEYTGDAGKPLFYAVAELQKAIGQRSF